MVRRFQSSPLNLFISFLKSILLICFVTTFLTMLSLSFLGVLENNNFAENRRLLFVILIFTGSFSLIMGLIYAFYRNNIKVEINPDAIKFFRGKKEYMQFGYNEYKFSSLVDKYKHDLITVSTTRSLGVIPKNGDKGKYHTCHCFAKKTFAEMIAVLKQVSYEWEVAHENKQYPDESRMLATTVISDPVSKSDEAPTQMEISSLDLLPLEFHIDKKAWIKRYPLIAMSITFGVFLLFIFVGTVIPPILNGNFNNMAWAIGMFLFLTILFGGLLLILCIIPINRVKKSVPEKIILDKDRIVIDEMYFMFDLVEQIKATPHLYGGVSTTFRRKLTITKRGNIYVFPVGIPELIRKKAPSVFKNYDLFYNTLQSIFLEKSARENTACKFEADLQ